jgi:hypothetical protein
MSYEHGWAALNMEMPPKVPRTEYSATEHYGLVKAVTGVPVSAYSDAAIKHKAAKKFMAAWDYGFLWNVLIGGGEFKECRTKMGHAVYADAGTDYDEDISQLFDDPEDVFTFDFDEKLGKPDVSHITERFNGHYNYLVNEYPNMVNMTGVYITCMSGLIDLLGWDTLLTAAGLDGKRFGEFTNRYVRWIERYFIALAQCSAPVVMVHDDIVWTSGAFLHPAWYREYVFPHYKRLFDPLRQAGKKIIYTSDGDYTGFIDDIAGCGVHGFVLEPLTDMQHIADTYGKTHAFIGNADTHILLNGTKGDIYGEVKRCMDIGKKCPGFFMAVGNHIPANTPVENALYYNDVYERLCKR